MEEYKSYDEYKDSGIKWIEKVPKEWEIIKAKNTSNIILSNINKKTNKFEPEVLLCNYTDVYYNDYIDKKINFMKASTSYDKKQKLSLDVGDVIITKDSESPDDIGIPSYVKETNENLVCGYHLAMFKPNKDIILGKFLFRLLESKLLREQFAMKATGITRYSISLHTIKNTIFLLPPVKEQQKIASFLDQKTAQIDKIVNKKENLIEELKEYKKSVITEAVTKGKLGNKYINEAGELVDEIEMKDSGIEWIGEIPEYWDVIRWKYIIDILTDYSANGSFADLKSNVTYLNEPNYARLIRLTDLRVNLNNDGIYVNEHAYKYLSKSKLFGGEFLIANVGAYTGHVEKMPNVNYRCTLGPNMFLVRFNSLVTNEFMYYASKSKLIVSQLDLYKNSNASAQPSLNKSDFQSLVFAYPNKKIQVIIKKLLNKKVKKIEKAIESVKESLEKYKEYKKSLIFEAVTGKIDLRDYELKGGKENAE